MTVQKLFESLDEKIFTPELKQSLTEKFEEAVQAKAEITAQILADELSEAKIDELDEKAEQYSAYLLEESQAKIDELEEKAEQYAAYVLEESQAEINEFKESITEKLEDYMDLVIQEFVSEAKETLSESIKSEKADMLIEAFDSMLISGGVDFTTIMGAKEDLQESQSSSDRVDQLVEEIIQLKEEREELIKMGLVAELSEGLTLVQAQRFQRLASIVEFTTGPEFSDKLETLLESIKDFKESDVSNASTASKNPESITESHPSSKAPIWSHLL